jgi:hypothetical protein
MEIVGKLKDWRYYCSDPLRSKAAMLVFVEERELPVDFSGCSEFHKHITNISSRIWIIIVSTYECTRHHCAGKQIDFFLCMCKVCLVTSSEIYIVTE